MGYLGSDGRPAFDEVDAAILAKRMAARAALGANGRALVGDFVRKPDGSLHRFTHDWGDAIQTAPAGGGGHYRGSYYLMRDGNADYSGGLDPAVPHNRLRLTDEQMDGSFWFFHHDRVWAHNGVYFTAPCRVFELMEG